MPFPVAVVAIRIAYRVLIALRPAKLDAARAAMDAVVGNTPLEPRLEELARRHPAAMAENQELTWRLRSLSRLPVDGREHLDAALTSGRGVVLSFTHFGPLMGRIRLLREIGAVHAPTGTWLFEPPPPGYRGYWVEQMRRVSAWGDMRAVQARGSRGTLAAVLERGGVVSIALDLPGSAVTQFLGKPVEMASGTARLARDTGSLVLPLAVAPGRWRRWRIEVGEPMDPADHPSWSELHQALATWHERRIMAAPERYEDPVREGAWPLATRDGWHARIEGASPTSPEAAASAADRPAR